MVKREIFNGNKLRAWREHEGMSQQELANDMAVSTLSVWNWENGKTQPVKFMRIKLDDMIGDMK